MAVSATTKETLAGDFDRVRDRLPGAAASWLSSLRREAIGSFASQGFPSVRDEDWKYTSVLPVLRERLEPVLSDETATDSAVLESLFARAAGARGASVCLVFVDGCLHSGLSRVDTRKGVSVTSLRERLQGDPAPLEPWLGKYLPSATNGFTALNTAFLDDGAVIEIGNGVALQEPIHVVHLATKRESAYVTHPRGLILAGEGSSAVVIEHHIGDAGALYLTNAASEFVLQRSANLAHVRIQDEAATAFHVARIQVEQAAGSFFTSHAFGFGAALSRTDIAVRLGGEEAECLLAGLYAVDGSRHVDHHLMVDHASPRTRSNQLYKGVLEDSSRGVFTGRVVVRAGSQKIQAAQSNPSLLLGRGAVAETRPQLEIYADDVACKHGATIGRLSEDALFYLLSRGIESAEARRILVSGFAAEVVEGVASLDLREVLAQVIADRMGDLGRDRARSDRDGRTS